MSAVFEAFRASCVERSIQLSFGKEGEGSRETPPYITRLDKSRHRSRVGLRSPHAVLCMGDGRVFAHAGGEGFGIVGHESRQGQSAKAGPVVKIVRVVVTGNGRKLAP